MSVQGQIERLSFDIADAYQAVYEKGGELPLPSARSADNLSTAIRGIPDAKPVHIEYDPFSVEIGVWQDNRKIYRICYATSWTTTDDYYYTILSCSIPAYSMILDARGAIIDASGRSSTCIFIPAKQSGMFNTMDGDIKFAYGASSGLLTIQAVRISDTFGVGALAKANGFIDYIAPS